MDENPNGRRLRVFEHIILLKRIGRIVWKVIYAIATPAILNVADMRITYDICIDTKCLAPQCEFSRQNVSVVRLRILVRVTGQVPFRSTGTVNPINTGVRVRRVRRVSECLFSTAQSSCGDK